METLPEQTILILFFYLLLFLLTCECKLCKFKIQLLELLGGGEGKEGENAIFDFLIFSLAVNQNEGKTLYFLPQVAVILKSHFCLFLNNLLPSIIDIIAP